MGKDSKPAEKPQVTKPTPSAPIENTGRQFVTSSDDRSYSMDSGESVNNVKKASK
jgi:hypothetical protein